MKWVSLCSGIGGFDKALQKQGHEIVGACEIDKYARQIYSKRFPGVPILGDINKVQASDLPEHEGMCAGFPCQAFSVAGKRLGFKDKRGIIFNEIIRIAKESRPKIILLENVKGLLGHDKHRTIITILSKLEELGYDCEWQIINSKYFVPQNRERIFIIAHLRGGGSRKILPIGEFTGEIDKPKQIRQIGNIDEKGHNSIWGRVYDPSGIATTLLGNGGGLGAKTGLYAVVNDKGKFRRVERTTALDANYWKGCDNHGQRTMIMADRSRNYKGAGRSLESPKEITNSLTSAWKDNMVVRVAKGELSIRRLTPLECERLQGFLDGWTEGLSDTQRYKCVGNAVTVNVIEYIVEHLIFE